MLLEKQQGAFVRRLVRAGALCSLTVGFLIAACSGDSTSPEDKQYVTTVSLSGPGITEKGFMELHWSDKVQLKATATDAFGAVVEGRPLTWKTSDPEVATVENGEVTAVMQGAAIITATVDGVSSSLTVFVRGTGEVTITASPAAVRLGVGDVRRVTAYCRTRRGQMQMEVEYRWRDGSPDIATLELIDVGDMGTRFDITATSGGIAILEIECDGDMVEIEVSVDDDTPGEPEPPVDPEPDPPTDPEPPVDPEPDPPMVPDVGSGLIETAVGETELLTISCRQGASRTDDIALAWKDGHDEPGVFSLTRHGSFASLRLTGTSEGRGLLEARCGDVVAEIEVLVAPARVYHVMVSPASLTLDAETHAELQAVVRDRNFDPMPDQDVIWASSDERIAVVERSGLRLARVTAIAPGKAYITAASNGRADTVAVTVEGRKTQLPGGVITSDVTWGISGSPYRVSDTVRVAHGATLTIEPGVEIHGRAPIEIWGNMVAVGTQGAPIRVFEAEIRMLNESHENPNGLMHFEHVDWNGGYVRWPGRGRLVVRDSRFTGLGHMYIWYPQGENIIERNVFINSVGLDLGVRDDNTITIRNNVFKDWNPWHGESFAIRVWAAWGESLVRIEGNSFLSTDRIAVRIQHGSSFKEDVDAAGNYWGTTDPDVIRSMIVDRNRVPGLNWNILFEPFLSSPHPDTPVP